jgi:hypothetical protein
MADVIQWGVDQLYTMLNQIVTGAAVDRAQISMNNQHLIDLNAAVQALPSSLQKSQMITWIQSSVTRQAEIASAYRNLSANFAKLSLQAQAWLKSMGVTPSIPGQLSGLGVAPVLIVVPVAIAGLALTAWAAVAWLHEKNAAQVAAISAHNKALAALVSGGATPAQILAFEQQSNAAINALTPKGGDPLSQLTDMMGMMMVAAAVFMFLPMLKDLTGKRRAA